MRRIRHLRRTRQIVQPIQARLLGDRINTSQQQIHRVWMLAPQRPRQLPSHKRRQCRGPQVGFVAHAVQGDVGLHVFGELYGVACLAGEGHQVVLVEDAGLVVAGFEDRGAAHRGFGSGDDGEVAAGQAEEHFPEEEVSGWMGLRWGTSYIVV
jgi:hypothetical protein